MLFKIYKASDGSDTRPIDKDGFLKPRPCEKAFSGAVAREVTHYIYYEKGKLIKQTTYEYEPAWLIELKTAEDFMALNKEVGCDLIISNDEDNPEIMIYDACIE